MPKTKEEAALFEQGETTMPAVIEEKPTAIMQYESGDTGLPEYVDPEDQAGKRRWQCLNVRKVGDREFRMDQFFDTMSETQKPFIDCVLLRMMYSRRLFYFNGVTNKNETICSSIDMKTGASQTDFTWLANRHERKPNNPDQKLWSEVSGLNSMKFVAGEVRSCETCPMSKDALIGSARVRPPCVKEYNFLGRDIDDGGYFMFRCRRGTAESAQKFLQSFIYADFVVKGQGAGGKIKLDTKRITVPLYYYLIRLSGEMHESNNYAVPRFEVLSGEKPHIKDGVIVETSAWEPADFEEWRNISREAVGIIRSEAAKEAEIGEEDLGVPPEE